MEQWKGCTRRISVVAAAGFLLLAGCTTRPAQTPDEKLQQQAAEDARQVHHDLKNAGQEAKEALLQARRETKDVISGAKQGWAEGNSKSPNIHGGKLDINHATIAELEGLPGIHAATAHRIAAKRPFGDPEDLKSRGILTDDEYSAISDDITTR